MKISRANVGKQSLRFLHNGIQKFIAQKFIIAYSNISESKRKIFEIFTEKVKIHGVIHSFSENLSFPLIVYTNISQ